MVQRTKICGEQLPEPDTSVLAWMIAPHPTDRRLDYFADTDHVRFRRVANGLMRKAIRA